MADRSKLGRDLRLLATGGGALAAAWRHGRTLRPLKDETGAIAPGDVVLSCVLDSGVAAGIDRFLDHYRGIGVDRFLFVVQDADSELAGQIAAAEDISLWQAPANSAAAAIHWCNDLLRCFGGGHLCVTVEPDELLLYPFMATRSLHAVGQFLVDDRCLGMAATVIEGGIPAAGDPVRLPVVWWRRHYAYRGSTAHALPIRLERMRAPGRLALTGCLFRSPPGERRLPSPVELVARGLMSPGAWF